MCQVSVKCPKCGTINKDLYLEETEGRFECENCGILGRVSGYEKPRRTICGKCGSTNFKWTTNEKGEWIVKCQDCGHAIETVPYLENKAGRNFVISVYDREDLSGFMGFRKKVTA